MHTSLFTPPVGGFVPATRADECSDFDFEGFGAVVLQNVQPCGFVWSVLQVLVPVAVAA